MNARFRVLALVSCVLITAVSGCGGDDGGGPDRVTGLTPEQILARSTAAAADLAAFRVKATTTLAADVAPGTLPTLAEQILSEPVTLAGEGPVNGGDTSLDLDGTIAGLPPIQANLTKVAGGLFAGVLLTDYKIDLPAAQVAGVIPGRLPRGLLAWASAPTEVGRETVDGVSTVHLATTIDTTRALADLAPLIGALQGAPLTPATQKRLGAALSTKTLDVWIGVEDLLPRRFRGKLDYTGGVPALKQLRSAKLDLDLTLSKLGEAVTITPPTTTEVLDLNRLQSLAGG